MQVWRMEQRRHGAFYELFTTLIKENRASPFLKSGLNRANTATPGRIVTVSEMAFALLIYKNYVNKWIKEEEEEPQRQDNTTRKEQGCRTDGSNVHLCNS